MGQQNFIFGYGSLVDVHSLSQYLGRQLRSPSDFTYCHLKNFRRCWNVAMDNRVDLPGYKHYIERETGRRPASFVTFLNIRPHPGTTILGILFRVGDRELHLLDRRERNYTRIEVNRALDRAVRGSVWTYIGLPEAKHRYRQGLNQNSAIVSQDYFNKVYTAYTSLGRAALANYTATTDTLAVPIVALDRRDI